MTFDEFIAENRPTLVGLHLLSEMFQGHTFLEFPWPHDNLSDDEIEKLKERLNKQMPLHSPMLDLWDWDIRFEDDLEDDWYFGAAFGSAATVDFYAETLADFFLENVEQYGMDYDQHGDSSEIFEATIRKESAQFITSWREKIASILQTTGA